MPCLVSDRARFFSTRERAFDSDAGHFEIRVGLLAFNGTISTNRLYIVPRPASKLILKHIHSRQTAGPGFGPRFFRCPDKYCNHSATEADQECFETISYVDCPVIEQTRGGGLELEASG